MGPFAIVIHHNIFKDHSLGLLTGGEPYPIDKFNLDCVKKTLCDGIVPAITFSAHTPNKLIAGQYRLKIITCILTATI